MQPDRWGLVKELLAACLELDPAERSAYLDRTCANDPELRSELESLIASYEDSGDPLDEGEPQTAEEADAAQVIGRRIGPYRIIEEIGEGGMSRVYLGVRADDTFRKKVAIKPRNPLVANRIGAKRGGPITILKMGMRHPPGLR